MNHSQKNATCEPTMSPTLSWSYKTSQKTSVIHGTQINFWTKSNRFVLQKVQLKIHRKISAAWYIFVVSFPISNQPRSSEQSNSSSKSAWDRGTVVLYLVLDWWIHALLQDVPGFIHLMRNNFKFVCCCSFVHVVSCTSSHVFTQLCVFWNTLKYRFENP